MRPLPLLLCALALTLMPHGPQLRAADARAKRLPDELLSVADIALPIQKAAVPAADRPKEPRAIVVHLATDKPTYTVGDVVLFAVRADQSCHLTLISIDRDGLATVLFPNDFEPDNHLPAGLTVSIPKAGAPYRLRLDKGGIEQVLAICNANAKRPLGVGHDFDRERFTILGDWVAFSRAPEAREKKLEAYVARENKRRRRRRGDPPALSLGPPPATGEAAGRTLLLLSVSEATRSQRTARP